MSDVQALSSRTRDAAGLRLLLMLLLLHGGQAKQISEINGWTHVECKDIALIKTLMRAAVINCSGDGEVGKRGKYRSRVSWRWCSKSGRRSDAVRQSSSASLSKGEDGTR